jgi:DNA-binding response OmpR family regulator
MSLENLAGTRILLVDDEPDIRLVVERRLRLAGFKVITAATGPDGLNAARREGPDAIVLDLMLPGIDGYQVCAMLKRDLRFRDVPIIILSARSQLKDMETAVQCGADAFVAKPFDHEVLLAHLRNLLTARRQRQAQLADDGTAPAAVAANRPSAQSGT